MDHFPLLQNMTSAGDQQPLLKRKAIPAKQLWWWKHIYSICTAVHGIHKLDLQLGIEKRLTVIISNGDSCRAGTEGYCLVGGSQLY